MVPSKAIRDRLKKSEGELLTSDLDAIGISVSSLVKVPLTQNQFDALVDFAHSLGTEALKISTLLKMLNRWNYFGAAEQFLHWGGVESAARRAEERELFLSGPPRIS